MNSKSGKNSAVWSTEWQFMTVEQPIQSFEWGFTCNKIAWYINDKQVIDYDFDIKNYTVVIPGILTSDYFLLKNGFTCFQQNSVIWLDKVFFDKQLNSEEINLSPVNNNSDWQTIYQVPIPTNIALLDSEQLSKKIEVLNGSYYLIKLKDTIIGHLGFIPFSAKEGNIGRIVNLSVLPKFQNTFPFQAIINTLATNFSTYNLDSICFTVPPHSALNNSELEKDNFEKVSNWSYYTRI